MTEFQGPTFRNFRCWMAAQGQDEFIWINATGPLMAAARFGEQWHRRTGEHIDGRICLVDGKVSSYLSGCRFGSRNFWPRCRRCGVTISVAGVARMSPVTRMFSWSWPTKFDENLLPPQR